MTGAEIKAAAELYVRRTVADADALTIINEALDEISDLGLVYATAEVNVTEDTWYELPVDATSIVHITDGDGNFVYDYQLLGDKIKFGTAGTYEIAARKQPASLVSLAVTPEVHPLFQRAIATYMKGYLKLQINDEYADGHRLMQKFEAQVQRAFQILRPKKQVLQWSVIRHA